MLLLLLLILLLLQNVLLLLLLLLLLLCEFKPKVSRFVVIKKGCITRNVIMRMDNPMKALGKWYDDSLGDHWNVNHVKTLSFTWLTNLDKFGLSGKYKVWINQSYTTKVIMSSHTLRDPYIHGRDTREDNKVEQMARCSTKFQFHRPVQRSNQLQLPLSSVVEEFKFADT